MSTLAVANKDFQDGIRSRALFVVVGPFTAFSVVLTYYFIEYGATASGRSEAIVIINSLIDSVSIFLPIVGTMLGLGIVFVAIAIAFSTATRSSTVATWGAVGLTILFAFLWDGFLLFVKTAFVADINNTPPDWFSLVKRLNPRNAFDVALGGTGPVLFYLEPWFGIVIFGGWLVVPLGLAYLRFERMDLT